MTNEQRLFNEYRLLYRPFINQINIELERYGLFSSQWGLLRLIKERGSLTFGEIAQAMYIEKPSVTKLVQKLIELDFVEIKQGKDKREKIIHLTAAGITRVETIHESLHPTFEQALQDVSEEEIILATQVLAKIRKNIING